MRKKSVEKDRYLLAFDTSTRSLSIALWSVNKTHEVVVEDGQGNDRTLLPLIDKLLCEQGVSLGDIAGIAVGTGPGSFTGIRVGIATAQGLAMGLVVPVCGVSGLDVLVRQGEALGYDCVSPAIDAKKGEIYTGLMCSGKWIKKPCILDVAAWARVVSCCSRTVCLIGDAAEGMRGVLSRSSRIVIAKPADNMIHAGTLASCAWERYFVRRGKGGFGYTVSPVYIKVPEAERMQKARQGKTVHALCGKSV